MSEPTTSCVCGPQTQRTYSSNWMQILDLRSISSCWMDHYQKRTSAKNGWASILLELNRIVTSRVIASSREEKTFTCRIYGSIHGATIYNKMSHLNESFLFFSFLFHSEKNETFTQKYYSITCTLIDTWLITPFPIWLAYNRDVQI